MTLPPDAVFSGLSQRLLGIAGILNLPLVYSMGPANRLHGGEGPNFSLSSSDIADVAAICQKS